MSWTQPHLVLWDSPVGPRGRRLPEAVGHLPADGSLGKPAARGTGSSGEGNGNASPREELPFGRAPHSSPGYLRAKPAVGYW